MSGGNPREDAALESEAEVGPRRRLKRKTPSDPAPVAVASAAGACEKEKGGARAAGVRRRRLTLKKTPSDPAVEMGTGGKDKDRCSQAGVAVETVADVRPRRLRLLKKTPSDPADPAVLVEAGSNGDGDDEGGRSPSDWEVASNDGVQEAAPVASASQRLCARGGDGVPTRALASLR